ncbi:MAG: hypothetical protein LBG47_08075 [Prevotellaceae bacterium]|nr:hypothetical protein [Prevotellaceae bacterium]
MASPTGIEDGVVINERVSVGVRYSCPGAHRYQYASESVVKLPRGDEVYGYLGKKL